MGLTSPQGFPYPDVTARVADGWDAIRDLAEAVDDKATALDAAVAARATSAAMAAADAALDARLDALEADTGWVAPPLGTGWSNFGSGWATAGYRKLRGITYLRGLVKRTANPTSDTILTLPAGYRPAMQGVHTAATLAMYAVPGTTSGSPYADVLTDIPHVGVRLDIFATGGVALNNSNAEMAPPGAGDIGWLSLNGISFIAEA